MAPEAYHGLWSGGLCSQGRDTDLRLLGRLAGSSREEAPGS